MPFLQEVGTEILIVMLCINGFIGLGATLLNPPYVTHGIAIKSPFDILQNMTATPTPKIVNFTSPGNSLLTNTTTGVYNVTANNNPLTYMVNNTFYVLALLYIFAQFVSGIFIWNTLLVFHFPLPFVALVATVVYFMIIRSIYYYITGR